jgi:hypothetical protein
MDELRLHASLLWAIDLIAFTVNGEGRPWTVQSPAVGVCDTPVVAAMDDLAGRLERAAVEMVALGPAIEAGEPWPLADVYGPGPESEWGPREVLAHVAEMLPFWMGEIERIVDAGARAGGEPPAFGRLEDDPLRVQVIGRDRAFPARELLGRIDVEAGRVARRLRAIGDGDGSLLGRHVTRGDLSIADIAERLIVAHLEGHVAQLRETVGAA